VTSDLDPAEQARANAWAAEAAAERADRARTAMREHTAERIPPQFRNASVADPVVRDWVQALVAITAEDRRDGEVPRVRRGRSLLIAGPTGTGKTWHAFGAMKALNDAGVWADWERVTAADLYAALRPRPGVDSEAVFRHWLRCAVLIVDDLAAAKLSEWTEEVTFRLVNYRYEHHKPTVFTTNVPLPGLPERLGERTASRLHEMCVFATLKGSDQRRRQS